MIGGSTPGTQIGPADWSPGPAASFPGALGNLKRKRPPGNFASNTMRRMNPAGFRAKWNLKGHKMVIGGFTLIDDGYGLSVKEYEANWSFFLQGDDAQQFRDDWAAWQENRPGDPFKHFLQDCEYYSLMQ
mgnify:CR=1 FL=1